VAFARVVRGTRNATSWRRILAPARPSLMAESFSASEALPLRALQLQAVLYQTCLGSEVVRLSRICSTTTHLFREVVKGYLPKYATAHPHHAMHETDNAHDHFALSSR
jgi:hypothetical protein